MAKRTIRRYDDDTKLRILDDYKDAVESGERGAVGKLLKKHKLRASTLQHFRENPPKRIGNGNGNGAHKRMGWLNQPAMENAYRGLEAERDALEKRLAVVTSSLAELKAIDSERPGA